MKTELRKDQGDCGEKNGYRKSFEGARDMAEELPVCGKEGARQNHLVSGVGTCV